VPNLLQDKYINEYVRRYWRGKFYGIDIIQEIKRQITCKLTNLERSVPSFYCEHQNSSFLPMSSTSSFF
jgi:hypothetical protein